MREPRSIKMSPAERELFRKAAERQGTGWTTFVREAGVEKATAVLAGEEDDSEQEDGDRGT